MVGDSKDRLTVIVTDDLDGVRADRVVSTLTGLPRSVVRELMDQGRATVDEQSIRRRDPLAAGTVISLEVPGEDSEMAAEPVAFQVVFEDGDVAVVNKPAGLVVHPGAGNASGTLVNGLLHRWPEVRGVGQPGRWGIVHRLDRDTSGVLAVAKTSAGYEGLRRLVEGRHMARQYLAMVHGRPQMPTGTIDAPIGRDAAHPTRMRVQPDGRASVTHFQIAEDLDQFSLLEVTLETGRTHQIRVHLASIGLPVVGDRVYGRAGPPHVDPGRVWLHARRLEFSHPLDGSAVRACAPLPEELESSLAAARSDG